MANKYTKQKETQKKENFWNIVNSGLAGMIALLSSLTTSLVNGITFKDFCVALGIGVISGALVATIEFRKYWSGEQSEYTDKLFQFVKF